MHNILRILKNKVVTNYKKLCIVFIRSNTVFVMLGYAKNKAQYNTYLIIKIIKLNTIDYFSFLVGIQDKKILYYPWFAAQTAKLEYEPEQLNRVQMKAHSLNVSVVGELVGETYFFINYLL